MAHAPSASGIRHDADDHRYEMRMEGTAALAFAEYLPRGEQIVFTHTWVPPEARGHGVAAALIRFALDDVRRQGRRVVAQCSYVARFIAQHSEYRDLLA